MDRLCNARPEFRRHEPCHVSRKQKPMSLSVISQFSGIAVAVYFFAILMIGLSASRNADVDTSMYFLSGRRLGWLSIGVSLIAADALCGHLIGVKGPFADAMIIDLELTGILGLLLLGWGAGAVSTFVSSFTTNDSLERCTAAGWALGSRCCLLALISSSGFRWCSSWARFWSVIFKFGRECRNRNFNFDFRDLLDHGRFFRCN